MKAVSPISYGMALGVLLALSGPSIPLAAEESPKTEEANKSEEPGATPGVEVDMEALNSLNPSREKPEDKPQGSPEVEDPALSPPPQPPEAEAPAEDVPPELSLPEKDQGPSGAPTAAQSPEAPMMRDGPAPASGESALAGTVLSVPFKAKEATLSLKASERLDEAAAKAFKAPVRLQLFAYAGNKGDSPSRTRRLALERAIAIRGYLMDKGIDGTRIDLRPQGPLGDSHGNTSGDIADDPGRPERVDIRFIQQ